MKNLIKKILREEVVYNSENKTITSEYRIIGDTDKIIEIENYIEVPNYRGRTDIGLADGRMRGSRYRKTSKLPKSQVTIGETNEEGLTTITIPYWLYKKNEDDLRTNVLDKTKYYIKE